MSDQLPTGPADYEPRRSVQSLADRPSETRFLFVKSWNEWAEGNYLEPDLEHGHSFLRVITDEVL